MNRQDLMQSIEEFFAERDRGSEFLPTCREYAYSIIGPASDGGRIVYWTKWNPVYCILDQCGTPEDLGFICQIALPHRLDVPWIRAFLGRRELVFFGDLDPPALLTFAWLRAALHPTPIVHFGVSDALLASLQITLPESFLCHLTADEREALTFLDTAFPDLESIVGPQSVEVLRRHRKIEQEAIISRLGTPAPLMQLLRRRRRP